METILRAMGEVVQIATAHARKMKTYISENIQILELKNKQTELLKEICKLKIENDIQNKVIKKLASIIKPLLYGTLLLTKNSGMSSKVLLEHLEKIMVEASK